MTENKLATQMDSSAIEKVLIGGDLSNLTPTERMQYYKQVCESIGLNPLTKPFDYILLKSKEGPKLTLYAKKDCTDQLRNIKGVSIDDVDIQEKEKFFLVKVKGHDKTNRTDVEIGVVNKADMFGDLANVQMKAVTKAKRRLTLSLCGLGWLDETEVETIPDAKPVTVTETGEIIEVKPVPAPTAERPYSPDALKERLKIMSDSLTGKCTDGQRQAVLINLKTMTGGEPQYHEVLRWLTGYEHINEVPDNLTLALHKWIHPTKQPDGTFLPDEHSIQEAIDVYDFAVVKDEQVSRDPQAEKEKHYGDLSDDRPE